MNFIHVVGTLPCLADEALAARRRLMPAVVLIGCSIKCTEVHGTWAAWDPALLPDLSGHANSRPTPDLLTSVHRRGVDPAGHGEAWREVAYLCRARASRGRRSATVLPLERVQGERGRSCIGGVDLTFFG